MTEAKEVFTSIERMIKEKKRVLISKTRSMEISKQQTRKLAVQTEKEHIKAEKKFTEF